MRLPSGGFVERSQRLSFRFNGALYFGHPGDTLASALLANGARLVGRSFKYHRPRGIMAAGADEPNAVVQIGNGAWSEPNIKATEVELFDGLEARSVNCWPSPSFDLRAVTQLAAPLLGAGFYYKTFMWPNWSWFEPSIRRAAGLGTAPPGKDPDRYVHSFARCDVLVVGAGPAGIAAALASAREHKTVIVAEADFEIGGSALGRGGMSAIDELVQQLHDLPSVTFLTRTNVFGYYDQNALAAVEKLTGDGARQRLWKIRASNVILATGAIERPLVFAGNDRPGVMLASAAQAYVNRWGVLPGKRAVVFANNDSAWEAATALYNAGAEVTLIDSRTNVRGPATPGIRMLAGHVVTNVRGSRSVRAVDVAPLAQGAGQTIRCDLVAMSGGWSPAVHLFSQSGGSLRFDDSIQAFVPDQAKQPVEAVGAAAGDLGSFAIDPLWEVEGHGTKFVDFANDVTTKDVAIAAAEDFVSVEHLKRYTMLGMGVDQGKTSNVNGLAIMGVLTGRKPEAVGTTKFRPPYTPVTFGAIAGPLVGDLYRPLKYLPLHDWHITLGAAFEEYAGWARPTAYLRGAENWELAAQREARAARTSAALFDGSPLGKIEVSGADAGVFLDRVYVGNASDLEVDRARYGLMLNENGIIIDDGVLVRLAENRYLIHTTSGGASRIAAILEEWLQCEWVKLDVMVFPVTGQWATLTVSGPRAADVMQAAGTDIDLAAFPHMSFRVGKVAGLDARVLRASFTGEPSYEISVPSRQARALANALARAGEPHSLTPIGLEALMILRTEKGYLHVGVDTDGTTLPDDVGMAGPIATKRSDFIGRRSLLRAAALQDDRMQLVGLASKTVRLPVGAHVLRDGNVPGGIDGYVTSSYHSPTLGHPVALGLVRAGRSRIGDQITVYDMGERYTALIVEPDFLGRTGQRLDA